MELVKSRALQSKSTSTFCPENRAAKCIIFLISIFRRMDLSCRINNKWKGREKESWRSGIQEWEKEWGERKMTSRKMHSYRFPQTLVAATTKPFRYAGSDKTSLIWRIRWICETQARGKKNNVQNALNVFHVWLHFCWHFSSVLINMETKLKLWLLVDFLPPLLHSLSLLFNSLLSSIYFPSAEKPWHHFYMHVFKYTL